MKIVPYDLNFDFDSDLIKINAICKKADDRNEDHLINEQGPATNGV